MAARQKQAKRRTAKPFNLKAYRLQVHNAFCQEVKNVKTWSHEKGQLPVQGRLGEERRLVTFLNSAAKAVAVEPNPYPAKLQNALKQLVGFDEYVLQVSPSIDKLRSVPATMGS